VSLPGSGGADVEPQLATGGGAELSTSTQNTFHLN